MSSLNSGCKEVVSDVGTPNKFGFVTALVVWSGHSCPQPLKLISVLVSVSLGPKQIKSNPKVKSGGQECPPHTSMGE